MCNDDCGVNEASILNFVKHQWKGTRKLESNVWLFWYPSKLRHGKSRFVLCPADPDTDASKKCHLRLCKPLAIPHIMVDGNKKQSPLRLEEVR